jgi:hypothetical protein
MKGRPVRRALALALTVGFWPNGALADHRHRVVLLEQPVTEEASVEVLARVRGELTAAGFEVVLLPATVEGDPVKMSETVASELSPAAVIFVIERPADDIDPRRIELWLADRLSRRTFVQSLPIDPDDAGRGYRRLAIQAVELLKARLAELTVTPLPELPPPKPVDAPSPPPSPPPPPPVKKQPGVGGRLAAGATMFQGFEGVDASFAPRGRAGVTLPAGSIEGSPVAVDLGATLAAFGNSSEVTTVGGTAHVSQGLGTIDVGLRFGRGAALQPVLLAAVGAYMVDVEGTTQPTRTAHAERTWSMFTSAGAGVWIQPASAFAIELDGQVGRAWAKTIVRIDGAEAAETGSPLVLLSIAAVAVF